MKPTLRIGRTDTPSQGIVELTTKGVARFRRARLVLISPYILRTM